MTKPVVHHVITRLIAGGAQENTILSCQVLQDRFEVLLITGPPENPANVNSSADVLTIISQIYQAAEKNTVNTTIPTRFLSRYDKSATNLKESQLWNGIGQVRFLSQWNVSIS